MTDKTTVPAGKTNINYNHHNGKDVALEDPLPLAAQEQYQSMRIIRGRQFTVLFHHP